MKLLILIVTSSVKNKLETGDDPGSGVCLLCTEGGGGDNKHTHAPNLPKCQDFRLN